MLCNDSSGDLQKNFVVLVHIKYNETVKILRESALVAYLIKSVFLNIYLSNNFFYTLKFSYAVGFVSAGISDPMKA